ncbi:MAG: Hsp20/alpha crystallin family protein [Firmicutes bacterium]|nr:Hsp20/alpha crystallin family protein [Bacillota bacterium]
MGLMEWNPFRELDRDMSLFFERSPWRGFGGGTLPRVNIYQTDKDVVLKAEIPGVAKEDLNIYVDDTLVRLSGQIRRDHEFKDENIFRSERYYGSFSRSVPLPAEVNPEEAKAQYRDGILSITLPKAQPERIRGRRIDIQ